MDFDRLRKLWQDEDGRIAITGDLTETIAAVRKKKRQFERGLIVSDVLEIGAGLFVAYMFAVVAPPMFEITHVLFYAAAAVVLLLCAFFVGNRIYLQRLRKRRYDSVSEEFAYFLKILNWRIYLLRNVFWWYLLPGLIAVTLVLAACIVELLPVWHCAPLRIGVNFVSTVLLVAVVNVGVYYLNQRAVRKSLLPQKEELEKVLQDLNGSE